MSDVRREEDWLIDDTAQPAMAGAQTGALLEGADH